MRNTQLDALRGIAVLLVLVFHFAAIPILGKMGWVGVDLFFVISGFLVSGLLFREFRKSGQIRIGRFLARRGFKIYPAYYLFLAATVIGFASAGHPIRPIQIWRCLIFVQNYAEGTWPHLWSLAVEEHFYIVLPIALSFATRRKCAEPFSRLPVACGMIAISCLLMRFITARDRGDVMRDGVFTVMWPSHLRIDSLSFGVLIAYLWEFRPAFIDRVAKARWKLLGASLLLVSPCFVWPDGVFMHTVGLSFLYCGFGGLLVFAMKNISGQSLVVSGLAQIGMYSYTIYLIHVPVLHWVTGHPSRAFTSWRCPPRTTRRIFWV